MYFGSPTLCFKAKDLDASRRFYEWLGMEVVDTVPGARVVLRLGAFRLGLFTFLEESWLNLRGADVPAVYEALRGSGAVAAGGVEQYRQGGHGARARSHRCERGVRELVPQRDPRQVRVGIGSAVAVRARRLRVLGAPERS